MLDSQYVAAKIFSRLHTQRDRSGQSSLYTLTQRKEMRMKISEYKSYEDLPLFLNATMVAKVLSVSPSSGYELMHEADFPVLKIGNRMVVPKEKFVQWVERHTQGSDSL